MSDKIPLADRDFTAYTPDGQIGVRVAVRGHVLGVHIDPVAKRRPGHEIAERIIACSDVAYLQGQVAQRTQMANRDATTESLAGMPTARDLVAAQSRLQALR